SSSAIREGDLVADELYKESSQCLRGSNIVVTPPTESSHTIWIYPYQNGYVNAYNILTLYKMILMVTVFIRLIGYPYRGKCSPTNNFYLQVPYVISCWIMMKAYAKK
nr:hypothetical protein [Tanacetum cinerariifolium]